MPKHIPLRDIQAAILSQAPREGMVRPPAFMDVQARAYAKRHKHPEQDLQIACCDYLAHMKVLYFSVPNHIFLKSKSHGASMNYMVKQKRMGLLPGVSDLIIIFRNKFGVTATCCAELKVGYGVLSDAQQIFHDKARTEGCHVAVIKSVGDLRTLLKSAGHPLIH